MKYKFAFFLIFLIPSVLGVTFDANTEIQPNSSASGYYTLNNSIYLAELEVNSTHATFTNINTTSIWDLTNSVLLTTSCGNCSIEQTNTIKDINFFNYSSIKSFELNDTYINMNQSILLNVEDASVGNDVNITIEVQKPQATNNYTATFDSTTRNHTLALTKTQLGDTQNDVGIVNITKIYTKLFEEVLMSNTTNLNFTYGSATHTSSVSPNETANSIDDHITFSAFYNESEGNPIGSNCTVKADGTTYDLFYSNGKHTRRLNVYGWTDQTWSFTVTCINSSYETKTSTGSFIIIPSGSPGKGTGVGAPGGFITTTTVTTTTIPEEIVNKTMIEKIVEAIVNNTISKINITAVTQPGEERTAWENILRAINPIDENGILKETTLMFYGFLTTAIYFGYKKAKEIKEDWKGFKRLKRKKKEKPKEVYVED